MEVDEIQNQACKFPRITVDGNKIGLKGDSENEIQVKRGSLNEASLFSGWPKSRIVRVSRASGGKDRHSKVWTSKGLRDRRVRLSVTTAIQFYDLQDRLGYDQPSKAVEWLLEKAASSIAELPSLNTSFPDTPKQFGDEKRSSGGTDEHGFGPTDLDLDLDLDMDPSYRQQQQNQNVSLSKSACSSTSETSKGSGGLSLARCENRIKARERARGRAAEKEKETLFAGHHTPISQNSSFTELLTGNINSANKNNSTSSPNGPAHRQWRSAPMDYFATGLNHNSLSQSMMVSPFSVTVGDHHHHHHELQQYAFVPDNLVPVATTAGVSDYNLDFSISSGLAGYNRGTLQSNSPSMLPHLQRFSPIDGPNVPFFLGSTAPNAAPVENQNHHHHHQFPAGFDGGLQLCYGDHGRHSDQKGKGKN